MIEICTVDKLSCYGSWASIIGLFITISTFLLVLGIKKKFIFRSRVEEHTESLIEISSKLSSLLKSFSENIEDIDNEFAILNVKLRNIEKGASGNLLSDIKDARKKIKKYGCKKFFFMENKEKTDKVAREIRTALNVVVEELKNERKELLVGK